MACSGRKAAPLVSSGGAVTTTIIVGGGGATMVKTNPLGVAPPHHKDTWRRECEGKETWFVNNSTGESTWTLPPGAVCVN